MEAIAVWWIGEGPGDGELLETVRGQVARAFALPAVTAEPPGRPANTFDPGRGQHSSTAILRWLVEVRGGDVATIVAVTDADLFIPVLTFVFGEARLGGGVAVVSTARLAAGPAGRPDRRLLASRLAKESIHELGHAFGLVHCGDPRCVMARSASLVHVDTKGGALCHDCRVRLQEIDQQGGVSAHER